MCSDVSLNSCLVNERRKARRNGKERKWKEIEDTETREEVHIEKNGGWGHGKGRCRQLPMVTDVASQGSPTLRSPDQPPPLGATKQQEDNFKSATCKVPHEKYTESLVTPLHILSYLSP